MKDELRAVIAAARLATDGERRDMNDVLDAIAEAVDALDQAIAHAQPEYVELDFVRWMDVRDGDLVLAPDHNWYRVITSVESETPATQAITMDVNGKTAGPYARPAEARVNVRRPKDAENDAIDALAEAFGDIRALPADQYAS